MEIVFHKIADKIAGRAYNRLTNRGGNNVSGFGGSWMDPAQSMKCPNRRDGGSKAHLFCGEKAHVTAVLTNERHDRDFGSADPLSIAFHPQCDNVAAHEVLFRTTGRALAWKFTFSQPGQHGFLLTRLKRHFSNLHFREKGMNCLIFSAWIVSALDLEDNPSRSNVARQGMVRMDAQARFAAEHARCDPSREVPGHNGSLTFIPSTNRPNALGRSPLGTTAL
jgi:hypothetical protein